MLEAGFLRRSRAEAMGGRESKALRAWGGRETELRSNNWLPVAKKKYKTELSC